MVEIAINNDFFKPVIDSMIERGRLKFKTGRISDSKNSITRVIARYLPQGVPLATLENNIHTFLENEYPRSRPFGGARKLFYQIASFYGQEDVRVQFFMDKVKDLTLVKQQEAVIESLKGMLYSHVVKDVNMTFEELSKFRPSFLLQSPSLNYQVWIGYSTLVPIKNIGGKSQQRLVVASSTMTPSIVTYEEGTIINVEEYVTKK
jgi:hypothetical protein